MRAWELIDNADVVIEGFRPGVFGRLGFDPLEIHRRNPRAVVLSLPGYASTDTERAGIQAWEGHMLAHCGVFSDMGLNRVPCLCRCCLVGCCWYFVFCSCFCLACSCIHFRCSAAAAVAADLLFLPFVLLPHLSLLSPRLLLLLLLPYLSPRPSVRPLMHHSADVDGMQP